MRLCGGDNFALSENVGESRTASKATRIRSIVGRTLMFRVGLLRFGLASTITKEPANVTNLVVIVERVMPVTGNKKGHFFSVEFHFEMFFLRLFRNSPEALEHMNDISPVNIVRCWVRENLLESQLSVWHSFGFYTPPRKLLC